MRKIFLITILALFLLSATTSFAQCDESQKKDARLRLATMKKNYNLRYEEFDDTPLVFHVYIEDGWHSMDLDTKNRFLRLIADADCCIHGEARGIFIYAWGEKVAEATPTGGFKIFK